MEGASQNNFKDEILEVVGEIPLSNTQMLRVLKVKDEHGTVSISAQKWWRHNDKEDWAVGKGFNLEPTHAVNLGVMLTKGGLELR